MNKSEFNPVLANYLSSIKAEFKDIPAERIHALQEIGNYILEKEKNKEPAQLTFICTHNSRRSHFGHVWATTAARYYGINNIIAFSGGTESTALNPRAVEAFERAGFEASILDENDGNPEYALKGGVDFEIKPMWSKKYDDPRNPSAGFAAVMVCSDADEACPFVPGAGARFSIPYDDPGEFDGTPQETDKYDERCRQVAREICHTMHYVKTNQ